MERAPEALPSEPRISVACQGLILMEVGYQGLDWQVDRYSRARAGRMLAATVHSRMAGAMVARELEASMQVSRQDEC